MKQNSYFIVTVLLLFFLFVGLVTAAPNALSIERQVFSGGGSYMENGTTSLDGLIGQPLAGTMSDELCSGFWCETAVFTTYLPTMMR